MAEIRPPFDQADATWQGVAASIRPVFDQADAAWAASADEFVDGSLSLSTTPPIPAVTLTATVVSVQPLVLGVATTAPIPAVTLTATLDPPMLGAALSIQTAAPVPPASIRGRGHRFDSYVIPSLTLSLECRLYIPRRLTCPLWMDFWQPPCVQIQSAAISIQTVAPVPLASLAATAHNVLPATLAAITTAPTMPAVVVAQAEQDLAFVPDNSVIRLSACHAHGLPQPRRLAAGYAHGLPRHAVLQAEHHHAERVQSTVAACHAHGVQLQRVVNLPAQHGIRVSAGFAACVQNALKTQRPVTACAQNTLPIRAVIRSPYAETVKTVNPLATHWADALPTAHPLGADYRNGWPLATRLHICWQQAKPLDPGRWWPFYEAPPLTLVLPCREYIPRPLHCDVLLGLDVPQPYCPEIDDPQPGGPIIIPIQRVYTVLNSFSLVRLPDNAPITATRFNASIDVDSWTWSWSAEIAAADMPLIMPSGLIPRELLATINGQPLRVVVEQISRSRRFASTDVQISGRGRAAALADPTAPVVTRSNSQFATAQQLLEAALTLNGVPLGWTVDWQLTDWLIPAGVWNHTGTAMDAATRIAEAGGGYVQAHEHAATLRILPRYPTLPWDWAGTAPDVILPEDVCRTESIEWIDKAHYNQVWVAGESAGILGDVRRAGTIGDRPAPGIVDPLITVAQAARNRGRVVLADTGRQAIVTVSLPLLAESGLLRPGLLVQYTEQGTVRRGLTRGVSLSCDWPETWQSVRIETHESV